MDLRRHTRSSLGVPATFVVKGQEQRLVGISKDISLGGMFLETDTPAPFGAEVIVYVTLPAATQELALPAVVRWVLPEGMGVQWGLLGARETHAITEAARK